MLPDNRDQLYRKLLLAEQRYRPLVVDDSTSERGLQRSRYNAIALLQFSRQLARLDVGRLKPPVSGSYHGSMYRRRCSIIAPFEQSPATLGFTRVSSSRAPNFLPLLVATKSAKTETNPTLRSQPEATFAPHLGTLASFSPLLGGLLLDFRLSTIFFSPSTRAWQWSPMDGVASSLARSSNEKRATRRCNKVDAD